MMMSKQKNAGLVWALDAVGASIFAWGVAGAISDLTSSPRVSLTGPFAILLGGLVRALAIWGVHTASWRGAQAFASELRTKTFTSILGAPALNLASMGQAAVSAIDHPATIEQYEARFIPARSAASIVPLLILLIIGFASWVAALILLATLLPFVFGMALAGSLARDASERQLTALGQLSGLFVDRVRNLPIIRHFEAETRIIKQVEAATRNVADRTIAVLRAAFISSAIVEFFAALSVALVAVYCGFSLLGSLPFPAPETLTLRRAFFALAMAPELYLPIRRLAAAYHEKQLGEAASVELERATNVPPPTPEALPYTRVSVVGLMIEWPGRRVGPVDVTLGRRGLIALVGPTGSGKTSVLAAISGQIAASAGFVAPIRQSDIAWAAQRPLLLPGTIRENIKLGCPDADDADVIAALRDFGLVEMVQQRHDGLDLILDHRGSGLSGGERRRVGLARAFLSNRPLTLLDEPTADLDRKSAHAIVKLICERSTRTAFVVATHDPQLIAMADAVVEL